MAETEQNPAPQSDRTNFAALAFAGLNLAVLVIGLYLVYAATLGVQSQRFDERVERDLASLEQARRGGPVLYTLSPFDTNLDGVPRRLIRVELSLEMMDHQGYEEIVGLNPKARDSIMRILNGKSFAEVETVQGKLQLKNQIIAELNGALRKGVVKNVYFNEFVVQ
jgi:flagellar FliL protein